MVWLGLMFNTRDMSITIPEDKLVDIIRIVAAWKCKCEANIHELHTLLGSYFMLHNTTPQCCPLFVNRMLDMLRAFPVDRIVSLLSAVCKGSPPTCHRLIASTLFTRIKGAPFPCLLMRAAMG